MMSRFPYTPELAFYQAADDLWSRALTVEFGKDAGTARYQPRGKGEPGTELRRAHDARERARVVWMNSGWKTRRGSHEKAI